MINKYRVFASIPALLSRLKCLLYVSLLVVQAPTQAQTEDPYETFNRAMYSFNDTIDKGFLKPLAVTYKAITPELVDEGVTNFFGNLGDIATIANDVLQFKFEQAAQDTVRVVINSTFGLLGIFDVATPWGVPKNLEDFGQTLATWGAAQGTYLVLPLLGPSSTRDVWRFPVDSLLLNPVTYIDPLSTRLIMRGTELIDTRSDLLRLERAFGDAALDPYTFQREAYLQRRRSLVYDGNPPPIKIDFEDESSTESSTEAEQESNQTQ